MKSGDWQKQATVKFDFKEKVMIFNFLCKYLDPYKALMDVIFR